MPPNALRFRVFECVLARDRSFSDVVLVPHAKFSLGANFRGRQRNVEFDPIAEGSGCRYAAQGSFMNVEDQRLLIWIFGSELERRAICDEFVNFNFRLRGVKCAPTAEWGN